MKTRKLTPQEIADIEERYGAKCSVKSVTMCPERTFSAWEDIMPANQKRRLESMKLGAKRGAEKTRKT